MSMPEGFGLKLVPPGDGGENVKINEVMDYLDHNRIDYDLSLLKENLLKEQETIMFLGSGECPVIAEDYVLDVSEDRMEAAIKFYPPTEGGRLLTLDELIKDLRMRKITYGLQMGELQDFFVEKQYGKTYIAAKGKPPGQGRDAVIEYYFNVDIKARPTLNEDGSVDFFNLNAINHCHEGELLARIIPEEPGTPGSTILGERLKPREVKRAKLKFGHNIALSENHLEISSKVDGHVMLVEDKVFVTNVYSVENVDTSTGNIEYEGSVQVNGNVQSGFSVTAKGNVIVNGVVEGAQVKAGGNIIIARGMNGMAKGSLEAGGNIISKFLENASAKAEGYISTESILHSTVISGSEIEVTGKRGFITGGRVCAANKISVKTLGSEMGAATLIEVGGNFGAAEEYQRLQKELEEIQRVIKSTRMIIADFTEKRLMGARFSDEKMNYFSSVAKLCEVKKAEEAAKSARIQQLDEKLKDRPKPCVEVKGQVFPGTKVVIGELSKVVQGNYKFCRFVKDRGDIKMIGL